MSQSAWNRGREMLVRYWQRLAAGCPWVIGVFFVVITALFFVKGDEFQTLASYEMPPTTTVGNVNELGWLNEHKLIFMTSEYHVFYLDLNSGLISKALDGKQVRRVCYLKGTFLVSAGDGAYRINSDGEEYLDKAVSADICILIDRPQHGKVTRTSSMAAAGLELFPGIRIFHDKPDGIDLFFLNMEQEGYGLRLTSRFSAIEYGEFDHKWMLVNNYTSEFGVTQSIPPEDFQRYIMLVGEDGIYRSYRPIVELRNMYLTRLRDGIVAYAGGPGKGMYLVTDNGGVLKARRISNQYYEAAAADPSGCLLAASVRVAANGLPEQRGVSQIKIYDFCQP